MGVFARIKDIATADIHGLLDKVEDPVNMAKHYIRQLEEQIDNARSALGTQLAAEQHYDLLIAKTGQLVEKRTRQAELAVDREQDDIAALAIQEKLHQTKFLQTYTEQRETIREQIQSLRVEIDRLLDLHKELSDKLTFLVARTNAAAALQAAASVNVPGDTNKLSRGFERMERKIMRMEAGTQAYQSAGRGSARLSDLTAQNEVQTELAKLKASKQNVSQQEINEVRTVTAN